MNILHNFRRWLNLSKETADLSLEEAVIRSQNATIKLQESIDNIRTESNLSEKRIRGRHRFN